MILGKKLFAGDGMDEGIMCDTETWLWLCQSCSRTGVGCKQV